MDLLCMFIHIYLVLSIKCFDPSNHSFVLHCNPYFCYYLLLIHISLFLSFYYLISICIVCYCLNWNHSVKCLQGLQIIDLYASYLVYSNSHHLILNPK